MRVRVATDTHIGSVAHAEIDDYHTLIGIDTEGDHDYMVLSGDVVDMSNCKKNSVGYYNKVIDRLKDHFGDRYALGNHECRDIGSGYHIFEYPEGRALVLHSTGIFIGDKYHAVYYSEKKTRKWAKKKWGRGKFSAFFYKMKHKIRPHKGGTRAPSEKIIRKLVDLCTLLDCTAVIYGHTHKYYRGRHEGIEFYNLPKGVHVVEL